jgi:hypothetical protein
MLFPCLLGFVDPNACDPEHILTEVYIPLGRPLFLPVSPQMISQHCRQCGLTLSCQGSSGRVCGWISTRATAVRGTRRSGRVCVVFPHLYIYRPPPLSPSPLSLSPPPSLPLSASGYLSFFLFPFLSLFFSRTYLATLMH